MGVTVGVYGITAIYFFLPHLLKFFAVLIVRSTIFSVKSLYKLCHFINSIELVIMSKSFFFFNSQFHNSCGIGYRFLKTRYMW